MPTRRCYNCMNELVGEAKICPACGFDNSLYVVGDRPDIRHELVHELARRPHSRPLADPGFPSLQSAAFLARQEGGPRFGAACQVLSSVFSGYLCKRGLSSSWGRTLN